jgi:hypothetical protein
MSRRAGTLLAGLLALTPLGAAGDPVLTIDASGCPWFAGPDAHAAVLDELTLATPQRAKLGRLTVAVRCPDPATASVEVTPPPPGVPQRKHLDLGDLPPSFHIRLVSLVVAEMVAIAVAVLPDPVLPETPSAGPPPAPYLAARAPRPVPLGQRRSVWGPGASSSSGFARAGVRAFVDSPEAMLDVAVGWARGPFAVELFGASRAEHDRLGALRASVLGVGANAVLACRGASGTWLCLSGHSAVGIAAVMTTPSHPMIESADAVALYLEAGPRVEIKIEHQRWSGELGLSASWSSGLVALAEHRDVIRMSGAVVVGSLTLGLAP